MDRFNNREEEREKARMEYEIDVERVNQLKESIKLEEEIYLHMYIEAEDAEMKVKLQEDALLREIHKQKILLQRNKGSDGLKEIKDQSDIHSRNYNKSIPSYRGDVSNNVISIKKKQINDRSKEVYTIYRK